MAKHVLGKITGDYGAPTGPDALLSIVVDPRWLREARTIELDLPRNLSCAACNGAGCDICSQSGALTVRERFEPPEILRVTLPRHEASSDSAPDSRRSSLLLRIQGRGGLPTAYPAAIRGRLLLRIRCDGPVSDCVREISDDQVTSSARLNRADLVNEGAPPTQTRRSQRATSKPHLETQDPDVDAPRTRRSIIPVRLSLHPFKIGNLKIGDLAAKEPQPPSPTVRRIRWLDILIGLLVMLLGAALAWYLF